MDQLKLKIGDKINTQGRSNMADNVTVRKIESRNVYFTDANGQKYQGMGQSTIRELINGGAWVIV